MKEEETGVPGSPGRRGTALLRHSPYVSPKLGRHANRVAECVKCGAGKFHQGLPR